MPFSRHDQQPPDPRLLDFVRKADKGDRRLGDIHGLAHWARVRSNGHAIADADPQVDRKVVDAFALLHDVARRHDKNDPNHGPRAAKIAAGLGEIGYTPEQVRKVQQACGGHTHRMYHHDATVAACWDSDRLDLGRVGIDPEPDRLHSDRARELLDAAHERASNEHRPAWVDAPHPLSEAVDGSITITTHDVGGSPSASDKKVADGAKDFLRQQPHLGDWGDEAEHFAVAHHPDHGIVGVSAIRFASDVGEVGYAVHPKFQRQGLASTLLGHSEDFLKSVNHSTAAARASSPESVSLLKKAGYTTTDTEMHNSWWEKTLSEAYGAETSKSGFEGESDKGPTDSDKAKVADIVNNASLPDKAEDGKAYVVHWADGRGIFAVRNKASLSKWLDKVGAWAEIVSIKYKEPVHGDRTLRVTEDALTHHLPDVSEAKIAPPADVVIPQHWFHGSAEEHPGLKVMTRTRHAYYQGAPPDPIKKPVPKEFEDAYHAGHIHELAHTDGNATWKVPRNYTGHQNFGRGVYMASSVDWARRYGDHVIGASINPNSVLAAKWEDRNTPGTTMHAVMSHVRAMAGDRMRDQAAVFYKAVKKVDRTKKALYVHTGDGEGQLAVYDPGIIHVHASAEYYPHEGAKDVRESVDSLVVTAGPPCPVCDKPTESNVLASGTVMHTCPSCRTWLTNMDGTIVPQRAVRREYTCPKCGSHDAYAHEAHADTGMDEMEGRCRACKYSDDLDKFGGRSYVDKDMVEELRNEWRAGGNPADAFWREMIGKTRERRGVTESAVVSHELAIAGPVRLVGALSQKGVNIDYGIARRLWGAWDAIREKVADCDYGHLWWNARSGATHWNMGDGADWKTGVDRPAACPGTWIKSVLNAHGFDARVEAEYSPARGIDWHRVDTAFHAPVAESAEVPSSLNEAVLGLHRYLDGNHQVVDLGRHGNFHVYSAMPVRTGEHQEAAKNLQSNFGDRFKDHLKQVHPVRNYLKNEGGMFLKDAHADEYDRKLPEFSGGYMGSARHATEALENAGMPHQVRHLVIAPMEGDFSFNQNTGKSGDVAGHWHRKEHVIRVKRDNVTSMSGRSSLLVHEWAHAFHDEMSKPQKAAWNKFYGDHVIGGTIPVAAEGAHDRFVDDVVNHFAGSSAHSDLVRAVKTRLNYHNPNTSMFDSLQVGNPNWWKGALEHGHLDRGFVAQPHKNVEAINLRSAGKSKKARIGKGVYSVVRKLDPVLHSDLVEMHNIPADDVKNHVVISPLNKSHIAAVKRIDRVVDAGQEGWDGSDVSLWPSPKHTHEYLDKRRAHTDSVMSQGFKDDVEVPSKFKSIAEWRDNHLGKNLSDKVGTAIKDAHIETVKNHAGIESHLTTGARTDSFEHGDNLISDIADKTEHAALDAVMAYSRPANADRIVDDAVRSHAKKVSYGHTTDTLPPTLGGADHAVNRAKAADAARVFSSYGASNDRELFATTVEHIATHPELSPRRPIMGMPHHQRKLVSAWRAVIGGQTTTEGVLERIEAYLAD